MPVLIDPEHLLTELYAISNVPTVVWIDEDDRIVRPNGVAFAQRHVQGVHRRRGGAAPRRRARAGCATARCRSAADDARDAVGDLTDDEVRARLHFRIAAEARRHGDDDAARAALRDAAASSRRCDFTIRRAAMPLMGGDPFGEEFMELYAGVAGGREPVPRAPTHDPTERPSRGSLAGSPASAPTGVVGMLPLRNSATSASTREHRERRRAGPSRRASAFSSTIASAVCRRARRRRRAPASRSASEMNGTPLVSSVCAFDVRSSGTAGLLCDAGEERRGERGDQHRARRARCRSRARGWRRCSGARRPRRSARRAPTETVTAPSCEASAPMPRPASSIGQVTISAPAPASSAATNTTRPSEQREEPELARPAAATRSGTPSGCRPRRSAA